MTNEDESYDRENGGNRQSKDRGPRTRTDEILILEFSDKGRPAKEIYKPKKRITDLGLEAQFSNLSTQEYFSNFFVYHQNDRYIHDQNYR